MSKHSTKSSRRREMIAIRETRVEVRLPPPSVSEEVEHAFFGLRVETKEELGSPA